MEDQKEFEAGLEGGGNGDVVEVTLPLLNEIGALGLVGWDELLLDVPKPVKPPKRFVLGSYTLQASALLSGSCRIVLQRLC